MRLQLFHHAARSFSTLRAQPSAILALNTLADNAGARQKAKRVGRGIGSGRGKTGGKGHKGQGQRSGKPFVGFEGGQTPLHKRAPKRGFNVRCVRFSAFRARCCCVLLLRPRLSSPAAASLTSLLSPTTTQPTHPQ